MTKHEKYFGYKQGHRFRKKPEKRISVAVVVPKYGLMGGAENFVYELTERVAQFKGVDVHLFANKWQNGGDAVTFHKIWTISFPRFLEPISFAVGVWLKTRARYDIIHSHDRIFSMDIFTFHGIPHLTWIKKIRKKRWLKLVDMAIVWIEKKGLTNPRLKKVLPVSSIAEEEMRRIYSFPENVVEVLHPGISLEFFENHSKQAAIKKIRNRFNFSESDLILLFVGMNFEIKNLDLILEAMAQRNKKSRNSFKLLVVGKGNEAKYIRKAGKLGVLNQVVFAGATPFIQDFYLASDIFIMPSRYDTFGMVVLEAMLAGLPVIISENVGARDLIDNTNGFVLPHDATPLQVSEILCQLENPDLRHRMGENAYLSSMSCSWNAMAEKIYSLYLDFASEI
ncbi:MAG: glycosyltransferase family 4 protein [Deltaproteobacteria bacterium]|nr:glycosyltransferase family 4 protein [Deltaproteobacteria bacterium]